MSSGTCAPPRNLRPPGRNCDRRWTAAGNLDCCWAHRDSRFCWMECRWEQQRRKEVSQLLSGSGIASIHFAGGLSQAQFARFVRAFPTGNTKSAALAEQLKVALAGETTIKVNEIRYIAEDSSTAGAKIAANLTAKVLGAQGDKFKDFLDDPNRLLQMILAAEGSRGGPTGGAGGSGPGFGGGGVPGGG